MNQTNKTLLYLVDDDALYLKSLEIDFIEMNDIEVITFPSGELCLKNLDKKPDIIVLDYHLSGINAKAINGLETLEKIKNYNNQIEVIMLSSQDKIEVAINCMHFKAFDYIVKSETAFIRLQKSINAILAQKKMKIELNWYMDRL